MQAYHQLGRTANQLTGRVGEACVCPRAGLKPNLPLPVPKVRGKQASKQAQASKRKQASASKQAQASKRKQASASKQASRNTELLRLALPTLHVPPCKRHCDRNAGSSPPAYQRSQSMPAQQLSLNPSCSWLPSTTCRGDSILACIVPGQLRRVSHKVEVAVHTNPV